MEAKIIALFMLFLTRTSICCADINSPISINETDCTITRDKLICQGANLTSIPRDIPPNIHEVYLSRNRIRVLEEGSFSGLHLYKLDFRNNLIQTISNGTLAGQLLYSLVLNNNRLENLTTDFFWDVQINRLLLMDNQISSISSGTFQSIRNLKYLDLSDNRLASIEYGMFNGLNSLSILLLPRNRIKEITPRSFTGTKRLWRLNMENNNLSKIDNYTFYGLRWLKYLLLRNNSLTAIAPYTFKIFRNSRLLSHCDFASNKLRYLKNNTFYGLYYIYELDLSKNRIEGMDKKPFRGLSRLKHLFLQDNFIQSINNSTLTSMRRLKSINLSNNNISSLQPSAFLKQSNLRYLYLNHNPLKVLRKGCFKGLRTLDHLHLKNCSLHRIEEGVLEMSLTDLDISFNNIQNITAHTFAKLRRLNILNLGNNQIDYFHPDAFQGKTKLLQLYLNNNRLSRIPNGLFDDLRGCAFILLNNNDISYIEPGAMSGLTHLKTLFFHYNKLTNITKQDGFETMISLELAIFSDNRISNIESESFFMSRMKSLVVYNNKLSSVNIKVFRGRVPSDGVSVYMFAESLLTFAVRTRKIAELLNTTGFTCNNSRNICQPCARGTYSVGDGISMGCVKCPAGGFYQDSVAAVGLTSHGNGCKECHRGTFVHPENTPGKLLSDCNACPEGTNTTNFAGFRACPCLTDSYRLDRFGPCSPCPSQGTICQRDILDLAPGYYWSLQGPEFTFEEYEKLVTNLEIESDEYDKNTSVYNGVLPIAHKCQRAESCKGSLRADCATGYTGPLCAVCSHGYYKRLLECHSCPSKTLAAIQISGVFCVLIVIFVVLVRSDKRSKSSGRATTDIFLAHVKILLGFYQVLAGILQAFSYVEWPTAVSSIGYYVHFIQLNILQIMPLSCLVPSMKVNAYSDFVLGMAGNVICVVMPMVYYVIRKVWFAVQGMDAKDALFASKRSCLRLSLFLLFVLYPSTCVKVFEILPASCHQLCPHEAARVCPAYLRSDYTLECLTKEHVRFYSAAYASLTYVIGFPLVLTLLLWRYHYKNLTKDGEVQGATPITLSLSFLHENYSSKCWYWETVEMARKVILTAGVVFIGSQSRTQIGVAAMTSSVFAVLHALFRPIPDLFEDSLQMTSLLVTSFNLGIGVLLKVPTDESVGSGQVDRGQDNIGLGILLVITNSLVIAIVAVRYLVGFGRFVRSVFDNPQCNVCCCLTFLLTVQDAQNEISDTGFKNPVSVEKATNQLGVNNTAITNVVNENIDIELEQVQGSKNVGLKEIHEETKF